MAIKKLEFVDAMRGTAILMVVLVHSAQRLPAIGGIGRLFLEYGQMGVQLFFVASAYTLCLSQDLRASEARGLMSFYLRRFFRIAPLYYLGILVYFAVSSARRFYFHNPLSPDPYTSFNISANVLFLHGFIPSANNDVVPGGWSIGTEMAFYAIFPLLFLIFRWAATIGARALGMLLLAIVLLVFLAEFFLGGSRGGITNNSFLYFNVLNQLPVFAIGITAYFLVGRVRVLEHRYISLAGFLGFTAACMTLWDGGYAYLFFAVPIMAGISFYFLMNFLRTFDRQISALVRIGEVSFSIYIFHFIFAWAIAKLLAKVLPFGDPILILSIGYILVVGLSFLLGVVAKVAIEQRGVALGGRIIKRLQTGTAQEPAFSTRVVNISSWPTR